MNTEKRVELLKMLPDIPWRWCGYSLPTLPTRCIILGMYTPPFHEYVFLYRYVQEYKV